MTRTLAQSRTAQPVTAGPGQRPLVQRKCACGTHAPGGGSCRRCSDTDALQRKLAIGSSHDPLEREADRIADAVLSPTALRPGAVAPRIQRMAAHGEAVGDAPDSVDRVVGRSGSPLDPSVRDEMETRFGRDFSQVRIHQGPESAAAARDVDAHAFTVSNHIVFGEGQSSLASARGRRLLAHELTHVVQQTGAEPGHVSRKMVQRDPIPVDLVPVDEEGRKEAKKLGIDLPTVSDATWRSIGGVAHNAGKPLSDAEKTNIKGILGKTTLPAATPLATPIAGRLLLHDTSSPVGAAGIQKQKKDGRGPRGKGVAAFVPATGGADVTRPNFFEGRRPSTTEFEKDLEAFKDPADAKLDIGKQVAAWKSRRDDLFRAAWAATLPAKQDAAFDAAMAGTGLTPAEIKEEKTGNALPHDNDDFNPGVGPALKSGSTERVTTSASWTVEEICKLVGGGNGTGVAVAGKEADLVKACTGLKGYFAERATRITSTVAVEIVEPGVLDSKKSKDTCNPKNPNNAPLPNPVYSADQYAAITQLYLRAAFISGTFPEVTTHFAVDRYVGGHCDPRCFDIGHLYDLIAASLGHGKGSTYGSRPSYGRKAADNVWWDDTTCHGAHP